MKDRRKTGNLIPRVFGSCLGLGVGQGTARGEKRGGPQHCPAQTGPVPRRPHCGGVGPADRSALLARCFSVNFYGMQRSFLFYFVFFVKLKKKSTSYT